jgi:tetratricopeptide (TPR) repeat protein
MIGLSGALMGTSVIPEYPASEGGELRAWQQAPAPPSSVEPSQQKPSPVRPISLEERADIFMARKAYADAVDYYERALRSSNYANSQQWNKLGIAYQQQLNYRAARKSYERAIHLNKDFAEPWNNIGTTDFLQNKFRKSVKFYRHALQLNPQSAAFHVNIATSYFRLKKYKESFDEYRIALNLDPTILTERSSVGTVVEAKSSDPEYYFYVAKVFASLGRAEDAVRYLRRAFEDGFKDQKKLEEDPDFLKISRHPAYVELMKNPPVAIKD